MRAEPPLGLIAGVDEHRAAARAIAGLDVVEDIADEPRRCEIDLPLTRRLPQQARLRLAAQATHGVTDVRPLRQMRAVVEGIDLDRARSQELLNAALDASERLEREAGQRDARLIRDDDEQKSVVLQRA